MSNEEIQQCVKEENEYNKRAQMNNRNVHLGFGGKIMPYSNAATMKATLNSIEIIKNWGIKK